VNGKERAFAFPSAAYTDIVSTPALAADGNVYALIAEACGAGCSTRKVLQVNTSTGASDAFAAPGATSFNILPNGDIALVKAASEDSNTSRVWSLMSTGAGLGAIDQVLTPFSIHAYTHGLYVRPNGQLAIASEGAIRVLTPQGTLERSIPTATGFYFVGFSATSLFYSGGLADTYFASFNYTGVRNFYDYGFTHGSASRVAQDSDGSLRVGYNQEDNNNAWVSGKVKRYESDGSEGWSFTTGVLVDVQPTLGADGTTYVATRAGKLHAIDAQGNERWSHDIGETMNNTQIAIGVGNRLYVATESGRLIALGP
jgi:hypothetical protein